MRSLIRKHVKSFLFTVLVLSLGACGGGGGSSNTPPAPTPPPPPPPPPPYDVELTVAGLRDQTIVLQLNSDARVVETLSIDADGSYRFDESLTSGEPFEVVIATPADALNCTLANATGDGDPPTAAVMLTCVGYFVGGALFGVDGDESIELALNGMVTEFPAGDRFAFPTSLLLTDDYTVTVSRSPAGEECEVADGTGSYAGGDIDSVTVTCGRLTPRLNLVTDLNIDAVVRGSDPAGFQAFKDGFLFFAQTQTTGTEPWFSDGTQEGTVSLGDLNEGLGDSAPADFTLMGNGTAAFSATDPEHGRELWITDGTPEGTRRALDIVSGATGSNPEDLTWVAPLLFFSAEQADTGRELWSYNPSTEVGQLVKDIRPGTAGGMNIPVAFSTGIAFDGRLYFTAEDQLTNPEVWISDGTDSGTIPLTNFAQTLPPENYVIFDGELYFFAEDTALYALAPVSSGSTLRRIIDPDPSAGRFSALDLTVLDDRLYFGSSLADGSQAYWVSDGTTAGTQSVTVPTGFRTPIDFVFIGGNLHFRAGAELWLTDGTSSGTVSVVDELRNPYLAFDNGLVMARDTSAEGAELWFYDGSTAVLLADIDPGAGSGAQQAGITAAGSVYFRGDGPDNGSEVWTTMGTAMSTRLAVNIAPDDSTASGVANFIGTSGNEILLQARTTGNYSLQRFNTSDDTFIDTGIVLNSNGVPNSFPNPGTAIADVVYFGLTNPPATEGLYAFSAGAAPDLVTGVPTPSASITRLGDRLAYNTQNASFQSVLILSDGTAADTFEVPNLIGASLPIELPGSSGVGVLVAGSPYREIWRTDGTSNGTLQISNLAANGSNPQPNELVVSRDQVFFNAFDNVTGVELYVADPQAGGASFVRDIGPGSLSGAPRRGVIFEEEYFFNAGGGVDFKHWRSDGTSDGTTLAFSTLPTLQPTATNPLVYEESLFFIARDNDVGPALWRLNQLDAEPSKLAALAPDDPVASAEDLWGFRGFVFFRLYDTTQGEWVLWYSDGDAITAPVDNRVYLNGGGNERIVSNASVFLTADDRRSGQELWRLTFEIVP